MAHTDARHHLIPPSSQGSHLRSFRPTATSSIQPLRPCGGGCPGRFFQHPVPCTRHSGCFVASCSFEIHSFLTGPILICCRCARLWKSSRLLSTPKIKPLMILKLKMILTSRIVSVLHVFSMIIFAKAAKCLQDPSQSKISSTFSFKRHKTVHRTSSTASIRLTLVLRGMSFSFAVYGLGLFVRVWFVF